MLEFKKISSIIKPPFYSIDPSIIDIRFRLITADCIIWFVQLFQNQLLKLLIFFLTHYWSWCSWLIPKSFADYINSGILLWWWIDELFDVRHTMIFFKSNFPHCYQLNHLVLLYLYKINIPKFAIIVISKWSKY